MDLVGGQRPRQLRRNRAQLRTGHPTRLTTYPSASGGGQGGGVALVDELNRLGGLHGVGRIDMIEDRFVGIKSREIYEAPAAVILHAAHRALEELVLDA